MKINVKQNMWWAYGALCGLAFALPVHAASFDCAKAGTKVEHIICDNPEISKLDDELAQAYKAALQDKSKAASVRQTQKQWMKERNGCADAVCVEMAYRSRIDELSSNQTQNRFITILSKDKTLCDGYKRYVAHEVATSNQYVHDASPMCQRNFGKAFPEFASVKWREISPDDHQKLAVQAYRYINFWPWNRPEVASYFTDKQFKVALDTIMVNYKHNWWHMWLGEADIGNTGHMETLLRVEDGRCGEPSMTGRPPRWRIPVMVLDASGKDIDTVKSEWILEVSVLPKPVHPPQNFPNIPGVHEIGTESYDVFSQARVTYFDRIKDTWTIIPYVKYDNHFAAYSVYQIAQDKPHLICRFKFRKQLN